MFGGFGVWRPIWAAVYVAFIGLDDVELVADEAHAVLYSPARFVSVFFGA